MGYFSPDCTCLALLWQWHHLALVSSRRVSCGQSVSGGQEGRKEGRTGGRHGAAEEEREEGEGQ